MRDDLVIQNSFLMPRDNVPLAQDVSRDRFCWRQLRCLASPPQVATKASCQGQGPTRPRGVNGNGRNQEHDDRLHRCHAHVGYVACEVTRNNRDSTVSSTGIIEMFKFRSNVIATIMPTHSTSCTLASSTIVGPGVSALQRDPAEARHYQPRPCTLVVYRYISPGVLHPTR